jgi:hypothetical protein
MTAEEVIAQLDLKPHPEGGWFRETFRDAPGHKGRAHSTAILYLLKAGEVSRWHKVDAAELWHWYGGAPLLLEVKHEGHATSTASGPTGIKATTRTRRCRRMPGRARTVSAPGRCSAAPWRRASTSPASRSRPRASSHKAQKLKPEIGNQNDLGHSPNLTSDF